MTLTRAAAVRHTLAARIRLTVPASLSADRSGRSAESVELPITLRVTRQVGLPGLHWSRISRPLRPDVGPRPDRPGHEAVAAAAPTHGYALAQGGPEVAVLTRGMPEVADLAQVADTRAMLSVTLLRSVGWLSRSDLSTRTASAADDALALQAQADLFDAGLHARMARPTPRRRRGRLRDAFPAHRPQGRDLRG